MGNRLTMNSSVDGLTTYDYDAGDRLLSFTDPGGTTTLGWDDNGNMIAKGVATHTFNALDRLTKVISGTTTVQFDYDGDGVRMRKIHNGTFSSYVQDVAVSLPQVLIENAEGVASIYLIGNDLLMRLDPAGTPYYYHQDGLGSTRAQSDETGKRTEVYRYDVFGNTRVQLGDNSQQFTYAGEQADANTGLFYLRSRYLDPEIGRFISRDRWLVRVHDTQSLNRYAYVANNPVHRTDPSGKDWALAPQKSFGFKAFYGVGAQVQYLEYYDVDTGRTEKLAVAGIGIGMGFDANYDVVGFSRGDAPEPGYDVRGKLLNFEAQYDPQSGSSHLGGSAPGVKAHIDPRTGEETIIGSASGSILGIDPVIATTVNARFRPGFAGDWFYDRYIQPGQDAELQRIIDDYDLEIERQRSWQEFKANLTYSSMGQPASESK
jgi:RHS repeat-associated protein